MEEILGLFYRSFSYLAAITMLFPVITSLKAKASGAVFSKDLRLFEIYVYFVLIFQLLALSLNFIFHSHNVFLFRIFLPVHLAFFSYLLLKWANMGKIALLFSLLSIPFMFIVDFVLGDYNSAPDFMIWLDAFILSILSFLLSYLNDKNNVHHVKEINYIHIGIYLYSFITLFGLFPSYVGSPTYGFFFQSLAVFVSNIFFAWSFVCLFPSRG